jgi:hypothetical protein
MTRTCVFVTLVMLVGACESPTQPTTITNQQVLVLVSPQTQRNRARVLLPPLTASEVCCQTTGNAVPYAVQTFPHAAPPPSSGAEDWMFVSCNQGRGNGPEGCDPGQSTRRNPSRDER